MLSHYEDFFSQPDGKYGEEDVQTAFKRDLFSVFLIPDIQKLRTHNAYGVFVLIVKGEKY